MNETHGPASPLPEGRADGREVAERALTVQRLARKWTLDVMMARQPHRSRCLCDDDGGQEARCALYRFRRAESDTDAVLRALDPILAASPEGRRETCYVCHGDGNGGDRPCWKCDGMGMLAAEWCGAWGGCPLPMGHNRGRADLPEKHAPDREKP